MLRSSGDAQSRRTVTGMKGLAACRFETAQTEHLLSEERDPIGCRQLALGHWWCRHVNLGFSTATALNDGARILQIEIHAEGVFGQFWGAEDRVRTGFQARQEMNSFNKTGFTCTIAGLLAG